MCIFSTTLPSTASLLMPSICVGTGTARDGKNCAGPESPITLKMSQMQFGNCPARPHPQSLLDALLAKALTLDELQVLDMAG